MLCLSGCVRPVRPVRGIVRILATKRSLAQMRAGARVICLFFAMYRTRHTGQAYFVLVLAGSSWF